AHGPHGKPSLAGRDDLHFNFSDSGSLGCLAVSTSGPLGVDIERCRERDYIGLADRYFSASEYPILEAMPDTEHGPAFFRGWTRKEAFLKAVGSGLSTRLDAFDVTIQPDEPCQIIRIDPSIDTDVGAWKLASFEPAPGYAGAVALRTGGNE